MGEGSSVKSKFSWPKTVMKKWLHSKSKTEEHHFDDTICGEKSTRRASHSLQRSKIDLNASQITDVHSYRIFASTWNVAGKSPPSHLNVEEWLHSSPPADVYVLGFQEIVPLNAGNVFGAEDNTPARKWLALIQKTLNSLPGSGCRTPSPIPDLIIELEDDFEGLNREIASSSVLRRVMENDVATLQHRLDHRFSVYDQAIYRRAPSDCYYDPGVVAWDGSSEDENEPGDTPFAHHSSVSSNANVSLEDSDRYPEQSTYCLVASKQMVGIFLTVWIKSDLRDCVQNLKVSCVGRGLMGYLGNKGSISVSLSLHQTSFCFICSHLTSGEKDGDVLRRNADVTEILRKTRFPRVHGRGDPNAPQTILEHDRIIWLGDLNYRIALSYRCAKALVEMRNWRALLQNDQLRVEQRHRRVFTGWNEGRIYFPPTYKYSNNSDRYSGENMRPKEKRRRPAWCDRILWRGHGLQQLSYVRGESRFSDHRPVYGVFVAEVESMNHNRMNKSMSSNRSSTIEVKEVVAYTHGLFPLNLY